MSEPAGPDPVRAALEEALEHPPADRRRFVEGLERRDPGLAQKVAALLRLEDEAEAWFEELEAEVGRDLDEELGEAVDPEQIGPYRVLRRLGQGGMGAVYLARRADSQDAAPVAIKLARFELTDEEALRRFRAERQILARLQHPGIARLFDGGLSADGRPFIVMEHVDGAPITRFAGERALGIEERLGLFLSVVEAVAYAHRNLVIHCDLKPGNVLVDAEGRVRLLDFGIAKLLATGDGETEPTLTAERPMTPAYAAPEQVRAEPVTTATDVYGLGGLLYELLAGRRPLHDVKGHAELAAAVVEREPEAPSRLLRGRRSARLAGDLDSICLKALRKEPERRYASADQLAEDVRRHLLGLPVQARAGGSLYLARRFVRRRRLPLGIAAAFTLLVAAFGVAMAAQGRRFAAERDRAERVVELLVDVLETSDPAELHGSSVTAREVLELSARRVEERLVAEPELQAEMLELIGRAFQNLGLREPAERLLESARARRRAATEP
jgi:serine/threonine-protein kinase